MRKSIMAQIKYGHGKITREETEHCVVSMETKELSRLAVARV